MISKKKATFFLALTILFSFPLMSKAQTPGSEVVFNIDSSYDYAGRETVSAFLQQISNNAYFYLESDYYKSLNLNQQKEVAEAINNLSQEFDNIIYPRLTDFYGQEQKPGIDGDDKITILFFRMGGEAAGYFNGADEYSKLQFPDSNEREMVYLNIKQATSTLAKGFLAHEFVHLITFNQKEKIRQVTEETWLNEARAEYAPTLLDYNDIYEGSILQKRVRDFLENPSDSLTAWQSKRTDYGVINLFIHYLADHYGQSIISDSLKSSQIGIPSINAALKNRGFQDDFNLIFTRWTIALILNDCAYGEKYCFLNDNLRNFRIAPAINFIPTTGESSLSVLNATYNWSGNWFKIVGGGKGVLTLDFDGDDRVAFEVPFLLCNKASKCQIQILTLDNLQKGTVSVPNFNPNYASLIFMPSIQDKISGFDGFEPTYTFSWRVSVSSDSSNPPEENNGDNQAEIAALLAQIEELKNQIANLQAQIAAILGDQNAVCVKLENDLYFGMENNQDVRCLQEFLKNQGAEIYPEGLITGYFGSLTEAAVIRFQEKYTSEILNPLGLQRGTGYVGSATRQKINSLLGK